MGASATPTASRKCPCPSAQPVCDQVKRVGTSITSTAKAAPAAIFSLAAKTKTYLHNGSAYAANHLTKRKLELLTAFVSGGLAHAFKDQIMSLPKNAIESLPSMETVLNATSNAARAVGNYDFRPLERWFEKSIHGNCPVSRGVFLGTTLVAIAIAGIAFKAKRCSRTTTQQPPSGTKQTVSETRQPVADATSAKSPTDKKNK